MIPPVINEAVEILGLPPISELVELKSGVYENYIEKKLQWVATVKKDELVELQVAKYATAHAFGGCYYDLLNLVRITFGFPSMLVYPAYFLEPGLSGPLKPSEWATVREQALQIRALVTDWANARNLPIDSISLRRVTERKWEAQQAHWELVVDADTLVIEHGQAMVAGPRLNLG